MAKSLTSRTGFFMLQGKASDDDGHIDPILTFDHECIVNKKPRVTALIHRNIKIRGILDAMPSTDPRSSSSTFIRRQRTCGYRHFRNRRLSGCHSGNLLLDALVFARLAHID